MKTKFLDNKPAVSGGQGNIFTKQIPTGNYSAAILTITGTTVAGEQLGLDDLGTVFVQSNRAGQIVRADMGFLNVYENLKAGYPGTVSGAAASSEEIRVRIPFGLPEFPNTQQPAADNELSLKVEFNNAMATRFGSNSVNVRVDMEESRDVAQSYDLIIDTQDQQSNAAGTTSDNITGRNVAKLYLRPNGVVNAISYVSDSETLVDNTPIPVLRGITNSVNKVESAGQPYIELSISENVDRTFVNSSNTLQTTFSGGGTMNLYKFRVQELSADQERANIERVRAGLN